MALWMRVLIALLVLAATAGPVSYAVHLEREAAARADAERAQRLASEILARVERSVVAVLQAFARIDAARAAPCSSDERRLMRAIELESGYIRAIARMQGTRLACSPLAEDAGGLDLGPLKRNGSGAVQLRPDVRFPGTSSGCHVAARASRWRHPVVHARNVARTVRRRHG